MPNSLDNLPAECFAAALFQQSTFMKAALMAFPLKEIGGIAVRGRSVGALVLES